MNYNKVFLAGNLTREPEVKSTQSGHLVAKFGLAINEVSGEKKRTTFIDCDAWNKTAELIEKYLHKGSPCFIEGKLNYQSWEDRDGGKHSKISVTVDRVQFLYSAQQNGQQRQSRPAQGQRRAQTSEDDLSIPDEEIPMEGQ